MAQQWRQECAHFVVCEPSRLETEDDQHGKESLDTWIAEAQRGAALSFDFDRSNDAIEGIFADRAIVYSVKLT